MLAVVLVVATIPAAPIFALMALGVLIATAGHVAKLRWLVALGLALLFLATAGMVLGAFAQYQNDTSDPRPAKSPSDAGF